MPTTIAELFYTALRRQLPDALVSKVNGVARPLSHGDVQAAVERLALALEGEGHVAGDRVALLAENRPEWALTDYACAVSGLVTAPVYPTLNAAQTGYILRHSGSRTVFCSNRAQLDKVLDQWDRCPDLTLAVLMEGEVPQGTGRRILSWADLQEAGRSREGRRAEVRAWAEARRPEDILTLIYTSGTTGDPKGAILTHGNLVSNIQAGLAVLQVHPGMRIVSFLPLSHIFERMGGHYTMFHRGVSIHYVDDVANLLAAFREVRPEVLLAVPRVFEKIYGRVRETVTASPYPRRVVFHHAMRIARAVAPHRYRGGAPGFWLGLAWKAADKLVYRRIREQLGGRVVIAASGGAPLGPLLLEFFWGIGLEVFEGYGLSETSPILALSARGLVKPGHVGRPVLDQWQGRPFIRIAEDGEILVQGPNVTLGYWQDPQATAEAFDADGYFHTGDIGAFDAEGRLRITDRKKEILVTSGGKNVAPQPLENLLRADKFIEQAVVVGDKRNYLTALVVPNFGALRRWARHKGVPFADDADLARRPEAQDKVMRRVDRINASLSNYERIRKICLLDREMTLESGLLTPSLKVKRRAVDERYAREIEALYAGDPSTEISRDPTGPPRTT